MASSRSGRGKRTDGANGFDGTGSLTVAAFSGKSKGGCWLGGNVYDGGGVTSINERGVSNGKTSVGNWRRGSTSGAACFLQGQVM